MKSGVLEVHAPVVVSQDSFYVISHRNFQSDAVNPVAMMFGLLGALIASLFRSTKTLDFPDELTPVDYDTLPAEVTLDPDWPVKGKATSQVIVIPYSKVQSAKQPRWGAFTIELDGCQFRFIGNTKNKEVRELWERGGLKVS
jgi:hypothetical protein